MPGDNMEQVFKLTSIQKEETHQAEGGYESRIPSSPPLSLILKANSIKYKKKREEKPPQQCCYEGRKISAWCKLRGKGRPRPATADDNKMG